MKLLVYSDLHLEFGGWTLPADADADVLILAGDIITFRNFEPLRKFLRDWSKLVLYVEGNHEFYTEQPMEYGVEKFIHWLDLNGYTKFIRLANTSVTIDNVNLFGGTMWTDFQGHNYTAMHDAKYAMSDYQLIRNTDGSRFTPRHSVELHEKFVERIKTWFNDSLITGPRVVISHHAPVLNPRTKYRSSPLWPAFNSLDMTEVIRTRQPDVWIYGHTHENDDRMIGRTRVVTNQRGYLAGRYGAFECADFLPNGLVIDI